MSGEDWDLVEELKSWPVDDSPGAREARRVAGGLREMTPVEVAERASAEVKRRLLVFEEVWEFVEGFDTDGGYGGITEYDAGHAVGYQMAAEGIIDKIREIMTRERT